MVVTEQLPSIGWTVHYRMSGDDISALPITVLARGNRPHADDVYPAMIVRANDGDLRVNLQVFIDGPDTLWMTSVGYSAVTTGCWFWPPRVGA